MHPAGIPLRTTDQSSWGGCARRSPVFWVSMCTSMRGWESCWRLAVMLQPGSHAWQSRGPGCAEGCPCMLSGVCTAAVLHHLVHTTTAAAEAVLCPSALAPEGRNADLVSRTQGQRRAAAHP